MSLFPIVDGRARFDASGNVASDRYAAGIRFTQEGAARSQTSAGTNFNQGIPMSESGQVSLVDASSGLPADVIWLSGLPISGNRVCISNKPVSVVSSGIPYDSAGAVAATVAPITTLPTLDLVFAGTATDPLDAATTADDTLGLNFLSQAYQIAAQYAVWGTGGLQQVNFADIVTFTRASTATYFNSAGTLTTATTNEARFDHNPSTLAPLGFLIEEQRTNSIRNNTMQGAVAGTPGTLPTNWSVFTALTGLTRTLAVGVENGIAYLDIRLNGTPSAAGDYQWFEETTTQIAAASGQTWTHSSFYKLQAGSMTGISDFQIAVQERDAVGGFLGGTFTTQTAPNATTLRGAVTRTLSNASTAVVFPSFRLVLTGAAIDITLRIGLPQLEQGAFATSVIPTTTTALTRSQDRAVVSTLSPWFNATTGTIYAEFAVTQPASGGNQFLARFSDNGYNNSIADNIDSGGFAALVTASGGVFDGNASTSPAVSANTVNKFAGAYAANDLAASRNGGTVATDNTATIPSGMTRFDLGSDHAGFNNIKAGYLRRITYYPRRLSNADLQTITA